MVKVKVYRSGVVATPTERGCEAECYRQADRFRPEGRNSRTEAIFAAPTIEGVCRWVRGNAFTNVSDYTVRELTVDADSVFVYSVRAWERASSYLASDELYAAYWATRMTLTEWLAAGLDPSDWELLLSPKDILDVQPVSNKRVIDAEIDWRKEEIKHALAKTAPIAA